MRILVGVAVPGKMLARGEHAMLLNAVDQRRAHVGDEVRILAERAHADDGIRRIVVDVEHRRERDVNAERAALERGDAPLLVRERRIARGAEPHLVGEHRRAAEIDVVRKEVSAALAEAGAGLESAPNSSGRALSRCMAFSFSAVSIGEPTDMMKPPTCWSRDELARRASSRRSTSACSRQTPAARPAARPCRGATCVASTESAHAARARRGDWARRRRTGNSRRRRTRRDHAEPAQGRCSARCGRRRAHHCDRALLGRIDVLFAARLEEERLHVLRQKAARLRIHDVEPVVVDQHRLLLQPQPPAVLADLSTMRWPIAPGNGGRSKPGLVWPQRLQVMSGMRLLGDYLDRSSGSLQALTRRA